MLDTWFSSALWPFSTMGWPDQTPLLKTFYPTAVLVTGFDILFFWVARMMMMGLHFMQDVPFRDVYVHALVRDEDGQKMSKSKGNVIDPLQVIERFGTDAFRFTLAAFAAQGRDIKMSDRRVEGYRHFINKLWNAARFALMHLERPYADARAGGAVPGRPLDALAPEPGDVRAWRRRWTHTASTTRPAAVYTFVWHEVCDWYLEAIKPALHGKLAPEAREASLAVLWRVLHDVLILLHPFIPFVTEEIWHKLPGTEGSIMRARFPVDGPAPDPDAERRMELLIDVISCIRNVRGEMGLPPGMALEAIVYAADEDTRATIDGHRDLIVPLARLKSLDVTGQPQRPRGAATAVARGATIFVPLEGIIDFAREIERLGKELGKLSKELAAVSNKLHNQDFLAKAPADIVAKVNAQHQELTEKQQKIQTNLDRIKAYDSAP